MAIAVPLRRRRGARCRKLETILNLLLACEHQRIVRVPTMRPPNGWLLIENDISEMKALQAIRRFVSNHPVAAPPLIPAAVYVIGMPIFIVTALVITRFMDPDPDAADALLMGAIMWMSAAFFVLAPLAWPFTPCSVLPNGSGARSRAAATSNTRARQARRAATPSVRQL